MIRILSIMVALSAYGVEAFPHSNTTGPGKWQKCITNEIMKCLSCTLELSAHILEAVISASDGDEFETVAAILESMKTGAECVEACSKATTKSVTKECGTKHKKFMYCKTDFCVKCCGAGDWQCMGNDFTPQCAPKEADPDDAILQIAPKPPHRVETRKPWPPANMSSAVTKCKCGPKSGDPDSCCSKCEPAKDKHNVPHCTGGGKNTGPFCGNDFHVTEPNACYGDRPLCCTNDMGIPVCCKEGQVCDSPSLGDNHCKNKDEDVVV